MRLSIKLIFSLLVILISLPANADEITPWIAGEWKVVGVEFARISAIGNEEAKPYIGKKLVQHKGYLESPFGNCKFCGLTMDYRKHQANELIQDYQAPLRFPHGYALVHELTWPTGRLTLIQISNSLIYVPIDGALFLLELKEHY